MPRFRKRRRPRRSLKRRRYKNARRSNRRFYRRRRGFRRLRAITSPRRVVKLKYCETFTLNVGAVGLPAWEGFNMGSLMDPNFTGTGHQPRGFDELKPFYNSSLVIGAKITVRCINVGATADDAGVLALWPTFGEALYPGSGGFYSNSPIPLFENPKVTTRIVGPTSSHKDIITVSRKFSIKKWAQTANLMDQKELYAEHSPWTLSLTSNNSLICWIGMHPFTEGVNINDVRCVVQIDYIAVFFAPKNDIAPS